MTDIERLTELHAKTTQGEWECIADSFEPPEWFMIVRSGNKVIDGPSEMMAENPDFEFIAVIHNELPSLLAELRTLREFEQTVRKEWDKLNANGLAVMEAQLSRAIDKLDEQRNGEVSDAQP